MNKNYAHIDKKAPGASHYVAHGSTGSTWRIRRVRGGYAAVCEKPRKLWGVFLVGRTLDELDKDLGHF